MDEQWVPIHGYEQSYEVSNLGRIRNIPRVVKMAYRGGEYTTVATINKPTPNGKGYGRVFLSLRQVVKTKYVHRLVAEHWCPNPFNYKEVNHMDGNKSNNNANNLEWCSRRQNCIHARRMGLSTFRLTAEDVDNILALRRSGLSLGVVGRQCGVCKSTVARIAAGDIWAWHTHISRRGGVVD